MTIEQAMDFIHGTEKFGSVLGLDSVGELLRRLDNPQQKLRFIHVAGTNGKGSTCTMLARCLTKQGYRTGLFTSPYLEDFRERIRVDGEMIAPDRLAALTHRVAQACHDMVAEGWAHPTEFELVTALGFLYFLEQRCELVVLEVGLGGRFDATNIIPAPLVAVICVIARDHMEQLGETLPEIAGEKCGIIKPGSRVVCYGQQPEEALHTIRSCTEQVGVPLYLPSPEDVVLQEQGVFSYHSFTISLPLLGAHQIQNALTVLTTVEALRDCGLQIDTEKVEQAIGTVTFAGRIEQVRENLWLDGAHNRSGMEALCKTLQEQNRRIVAVCGMLRDKEYEACAALLADVADVIVTTEPANPRKLPAEEFARVFSTPWFESDPQKALALAESLAHEDDLICVCGSLYLLGEIRSLVFGR